MVGRPQICQVGFQTGNAAVQLRNMLLLLDLIVMQVGNVVGYITKLGTQVQLAGAIFF